MELLIEFGCKDKFPLYVANQIKEQLEMLLKRGIIDCYTISLHTLEEDFVILAAQDYETKEEST